MYNLEKKQKIVLSAIAIIIIGSICYYIYAKEEKENTQIINNLEIQSTEEQKEDKENHIIVHVSGAVKKEGVVELEENSRIADAIEKARRNKRWCIYKWH